MVRKPRNDSPGTWHHAMNRAIARRPIFETREDVRYFLAGVARSVRRGQLEVHAWCVMTTHFHMLVRSPIGELSEAMHRIQNAFTRYFNRKRRRIRGAARGNMSKARDHVGCTGNGSKSWSPSDRLRGASIRVLIRDPRMSGSVMCSRTWCKRDSNRPAQPTSSIRY